MSTVALLVALVAGGQPCPIVQPFQTPFIGTPSRTFRADADVRVNDFPVHMFLARMVALEGSPSSFVAIHPYVMRAGDNRCGVTSEVTEALPFTVVELDARQETTKRTLTTFAVGHPSNFAWRARVPEWRWNHGRRIPDDVATRDSLYAAYERLHQAVEKAPGADREVFEDVSQDLREFAVASQLAAGRPFALWQTFYDTAVRRAAIGGRVAVEPLVARDETTLHVFASGTLAYLAMRPARDAPEFPVAVAMFNSDGGGYMNIVPWFRLGDDGAWHVDGMTKDSRTF